MNTLIHANTQGKGEAMRETERERRTKPGYIQYRFLQIKR